jgi:lambda family phage portal protein
MNVIDKVLLAIAPGVAASRAESRAKFTRAELRNKHATRTYEAATKGRRTDGWMAMGTDANAEIGVSLTTLRDRSRALRRDNPFASRAISGIANNMVGTGIIPAPRGRTKSATAAAMQLWKEWGETSLCDASGGQNFYGLQNLAAQSVSEGGEIIIRRRRRKSEDGLPVPLQIEVLEGDFIDHGKNIELAGGNRIVQGVQFDALGRRMGYWLFQQHPGATNVWKSLESKFVPAEDVIHVYRVERPGQIHGVPWGTPAILRARQADELDDAVMEQAKVAACFAAFVTGTGDTDLPDGQAPPLIERVEPGIIERLNTGEEITFGSPPTFNGYQPYMQQAMHAIAVGYGVPYELLTGDLSNVNFSSGRMGWLEFGRNIDDWRWRMLIPQMCEGVWKWFMEAAELSGRVREFVPAQWTPPRRDMVDPAKETTTIKEQVRNGLLPLTDGIREMGYSDPEAVLQQYAETNALLDSLGLILDCDPRKVGAPGSTPIAPDAAPAAKK